MFRSSGLFKSLNLKLNLVDTKSLNTKLKLKTTFKPRENKRHPRRHSNPNIQILGGNNNLVVQDLLQSLNLRISQLNSIKNIEKKKKFQSNLSIDNPSLTKKKPHHLVKYFENTVKQETFKSMSNRIQAAAAPSIEKNPTNSSELDKTSLENKAKLQRNSLENSFKVLMTKRENPTNEVYEQLRFKEYNKKYNDNLRAYVEVCCSSSELLDEAFELINKLSYTNISLDTNVGPDGEVNDVTIASIKPKSDEDSKKNMNHVHINDIEIYNRIMFEYAKTGKVNKIYLLFKIFNKTSEAYDKDDERRIKPNLRSYMAALQAYGYNIINKNYSIKEELTYDKFQIHRILEDVKKYGYSIGDISKCRYLSSEQKEHIKAAIITKIPSFNFVRLNELSNNNFLIEELLNKNRQTKPSKIETAFYPPQIVDKQTIMANLERQMNMEQNVYIEVPSILKSKLNNTRKEKMARLKKAILNDFRLFIRTNLIKQLALIENSNNFEKWFMHPFLKVMDISVYENLILDEIIQLAQYSEFYSPSLVEIAFSLGSKLDLKYQQYVLGTTKNLERIKEIYEAYTEMRIDGLRNADERTKNLREDWLDILENKSLAMNSENISWPNSVKFKIGMFLLENVLLASCKIETNKFHRYRIQKYSPGTKYINGFHVIYRQSGYYKERQIKIDPGLASLLKDLLIFEAIKLPMLAPPMPWHSPNQGGYFLTKCNLIRLDQKNLKHIDLVENELPNNMYPIYDSLNILSNASWRINKTILEIVIKIFNEGGSHYLDVAQPESAGPAMPKVENFEKLTKDEKIAFYKERSNVQKIRAEMHSLWCTELYKLSIANMYKDDIFWFPHSLDFRGRTYPIPPHFNHLGNDLSRGLILLGEGKKLGSAGLDMLKIHLINLTGTMKRSSIKERLDYANEIIDDIIDSASNPLNGKGWWKKSEEKWQTLACCIEIANAIQSNDPSNYICHYPIHQDGSCNGLQHYAALGRDQEGAVSVNLYPSEKPQDIYSTVMDLIEEARKKDESTVEIARQLNGFLKRKTIKQTVMTTVYNVTIYGAKLQIAKQLDESSGFPQDKKIEASTYLAKKTFESIRQLFCSAQRIQDWLCECAYLISTVRNVPVRWETPLGLPVAQPYYKPIANPADRSKVVDTRNPDCNKQRNAFPPNYIHSLDSCHMMLTALFCERAGISFVSVHDCYWTHPSDVETMNKICREQFVALHSLPLLEYLSKYFLDNFKFTNDEITNASNEKTRQAMIAFNKKLASVPEKGSFDLNNVLRSRYFFS